MSARFYLAYSVSSVLVLLAILYSLPAHAQLISISPEALEVSDRLPPLLKRLTGFGFIAAQGTDYEVVIEIKEQPALVVAVGAEIRGLAFDSSLQQLTVSVTYNGEEILADKRVDLPASSFFLILDSGANPLAGSPPPGSVKSIDISANRCFGTGTNLSDLNEKFGNFGDEDGLLVQEVPLDDEGAGVPPSAAGAYASTNAFYWCALRPSAANPLGFEIVGPENGIGRLSFYAPNSYLAGITGTDVLNVTAEQFAVFADGVEVSIDTSDSAGGVLMQAKTPFTPGSTKVISGAAAKSRVPGQLAAAATLSRKTLALGERLALSIAADSLAPTAAEVEIFGFVNSLVVVGETVEVVRLNEGCGPADRALRGTILSRTIIGADLSWSTRVPLSAIFPNFLGKSKLAAQTVGSDVRQSSEISLTTIVKRPGGRKPKKPKKP